MRKTIILITIIVIFFSLFTFFLPVETGVASGDIIYVDVDYDSSTPGWQIDRFDKIKDGVSAANNNDTIDTVYVYAGEYEESNVEITSNLTLTGVNKENVIIDVKKDNSHVIYAYGITGNEIEVRISGFTIQNAGEGGFDGIQLRYVNNGVIDDNRIRNCGGEGVEAYKCNNVTIKDNIISNNDVSGISLTLSSNNVIHSNIIQDNGDNGIYLYYSSNYNEFYDNTITGHNGGKGVKIVYPSDNNVFYLNSFLDNKQNAYDPSTNSWDDGAQGNYWDDYNGYDNFSGPNQDQPGNDGIGDTKYDIPGGSNQDRYPLGYFLVENQEPVAYIDSISPNPATKGQTVNFNGHWTDDGTIIHWEWKSNIDGVISNSEDFSSSSLSVGSHTIQFRVKDNDEYWSEYDSKTLVINSQGDQENQKPTCEIITISPSVSTEGEPIYFHGIGQDTDGTIMEYSWRSSKDGFLSNESTFTNSDLSDSLHTIYFKVKDNDEQWSSEVSKNILVNPSSSNELPVADPSGPYSGYVNASISFDASDSSDPDDEIVSYVWDFGDGINGTGIYVEHIYDSLGNYTVNLTVTDGEGKSNTVSTYANVSINPSDQNGSDEDITATPGFELIALFIIVALIVLCKKRLYFKF